MNKNFSSTYLTVVLMLLFTGIYFFLIVGKPISALTLAGHDDALFFRALDHILKLDWLGPYDNLTLAKGPMLPIISAVSVVLGLPAKTSEAVIYLCAAIAAFLLARRIGLHPIAALFFYFFILFNPYFWSLSGSRFLRESLYSSFTLLAVVFSVFAIIKSSNFAKNLSAVGVGFSSGCAYLTREEDIWIFSTLAMIFLTAISLSVLRRGVEYTLGSWKLAMKLSFIGFLALFTVVSPVMLANRLAYGTSVVSEFRSPEFRGAMGALGRVGDIHPSGLIPVQRSALDAIFEVAPVTEGIRDQWPRIAEGWHNDLISEFPGEVAGGWFAWAFRNAVAADGHYSSGQAARNFYRQLANEVNSACDEGRLTCRRKRSSNAPELTVERLPDLVKTTWQALIHTAFMRGEILTAARSGGDISSLLLWDNRIGPVVVDSAYNYSLSGWIAAKNGRPYIEVFENFGIRFQHLSFTRPTDVEDYFASLGWKTVQAIRFSMKVDCIGDDCRINAALPNGTRTSISLVNPVEGTMPLQPPFFGYFDHVERKSHTEFGQHPLEDIKGKMVKVVVEFCQVVVPILSISSTLGIVIFLIFLRYHQRSDFLFIFALGSATAVVGRCAIIAYISISSWPAVNIGYLGPAYPFMVIYSVVGTILLFNIILDRFSGGGKIMSCDANS